MKIEIVPCVKPFPDGSCRIQAQWQGKGELQTVQSAVIQKDTKPHQIAQILYEMGRIVEVKM